MRRTRLKKKKKGTNIRFALWINCRLIKPFCPEAKQGRRNFIAAPAGRRQAAPLAFQIPDRQRTLSQLSSFLAESVQEKCSDISQHFLRPCCVSSTAQEKQQLASIATRTGQPPKLKRPGSLPSIQARPRQKISDKNQPRCDAPTFPTPDLASYISFLGRLQDFKWHSDSRLRDVMVTQVSPARWDGLFAYPTVKVLTDMFLGKDDTMGS